MTNQQGRPCAIRAGMKVGAIAVAITLLAGCSTLGKNGPRKHADFYGQVGVENQPVIWPVRSVSSFNDSLSCMDRMLRDNHINQVTVTSKTIPDASGKVYVAATDMVITSLSEMSRLSNTFRFVDYEVDPLNQDTVQTLSGLMLQNNQMMIPMPELYVSGAISFMDQNVLVDRRGVGAASNDAEIGWSRDLFGSVMGMEFHLGDFISRTLIPGIHSANEITIANKGSGIDIGGRIKKAGVQLEIGGDYSQGVGPAARTLIDLSMIELVGKWARVPYWQCLTLDQAHPDFQRQLRQWYLQMDEDQRVAFIQRGLRANGYYYATDATPRQITPELRVAIQRFQLDQGLLATGQLSFETYEHLARDYVRSDGDGNFVQVGWGDTGLTASRLPLHSRREPRSGAPALDSTTPRLPRIDITLPTPGNVRALGELLAFNISVDRTSYLQCYYRDAKGTIAQIYPNPLQPADVVEGNRALLVPDTSNPQSFAIELTAPGTEELRCLTSSIDPSSRLPALLQAPVLTPIRAASLDEVEQAFRSAVGAGVGAGRAQWSVTR
ncbi:MAG TPA: DUF4384 domain-containing protein [Lysobacter sp.]|nr:DUF4384 domain-containing protein [Lysobacter sp.]